MTKVRGTGESVQMDEDWFVRRDGSMFPVSYTSTPIEMADGPLPRHDAERPIELAERLAHRADDPPLSRPGASGESPIDCAARCRRRWPAERRSSAQNGSRTRPTSG